MGQVRRRAGGDVGCLPARPRRCGGERARGGARRPRSSAAPELGLGSDALALLGLLALARFALAAAAWDTGSGFSLMGASRDLTLSVFVEATLALALAVAALTAGSTDLRVVVAGTAGADAWSRPALALAAVAFATWSSPRPGASPSTTRTRTWS